MNIIVVRCPQCSQKYRLGEEKIGLRARCRCGVQFRVAREGATIDDETIFGWVMEDADPASHSVIGGSGIIDPHSHKPHRDQLSKPVVMDQTTTAGLHLDTIDEAGAHFSFAPEKLREEPFRTSLPKQCICCNSKRSLNLYLVVWYDQLSSDDRYRQHAHHFREVGRLNEVAQYEQPDWLAHLPPAAALPEPYQLPMPFYACPSCHIADEITTQVRRVEGIEHCRLTISNLEVAAKFFRNNGGRKEPAYSRLVQEYERQARDAWLSLPSNVRRQISHWHQPEENERFHGYFRDADFIQAEAGKAGVVLTDQRLVFHKYTSSRDFPLQEGGKIQLEPQQRTTGIRIVQKGRKDALLHMEPEEAQRLLERIQTIGSGWKISGEYR